MAGSGWFVSRCKWGARPTHREGDGEELGLVRLEGVGDPRLQLVVAAVVDARVRLRRLVVWCVVSSNRKVRVKAPHRRVPFESKARQRTTKPHPKHDATHQLDGAEEQHVRLAPAAAAATAAPALPRLGGPRLLLLLLIALGHLRVPALLQPLQHALLLLRLVVVRPHASCCLLLRACDAHSTNRTPLRTLPRRRARRISDAGKR